MGYQLVPSTRFKKQLKKIKLDRSKKKVVSEVINLLAKGGHSALKEKHRAHQLKGNYKDHWECHAMPDLLIIWRQFEKPNKEILLIEVGSHSDLFG